NTAGSEDVKLFFWQQVTGLGQEVKTWTRKTQSQYLSKKKNENSSLYNFTEVSRNRTRLTFFKFLIS
ncbi:hypothetical protein HGM15179_001994, partial [Zosterops borbonicus]